MYDSFLEEKTAIPKECFHEVCFEELEQDPVGEVAKLYSALGLPAFSVVEPALCEYVGSLKGYRKNVLPDLAPDLRVRIAHEWQGYFQAWGYLA